MSRRRRRLLALALGLTLPACDRGAAADEGATDASEGVSEAPSIAERPAEARDDAAPTIAAPPEQPGAIDPHHGARTALERARQVQIQALPQPREIRRAERAMMVYGAPRFDAPFRGKIDHGERFAVYDAAEGPACRGPGWARIGAGAYACLERTRIDRGTPRELPVLARGQLTPYFYARLRRKGSAAEPPAAPRWASRRALAAGEPPVDHLVPEHDYAFEQRRPSPHGPLLVDARRRVVREADVRRLEPSAFAGRDVVARPLPATGMLAWSLVWPHATARAEPDPEGARVEVFEHQRELFVTGEVVRRRGVDWVEAVARDDGSPGGWIDTDEVRWWIAAARPPGVGDDELWIDVELEQQTLGVLVGDAPIFLTMIASGKSDHATPTGVFRIRSKMALSDMDSLPGDEEAYAVEGVPWAQFFHKRYGLHGTFWHNRFGRRTSHGCVNLSAHDAALVFAMTRPDPLPGWSMAFHHDEEPGTVVRVRKGLRMPPDRRGDPGE